ncbi:MAG: thioredoxin family protein [Kiritimatiellae bacterium]|nr:thioredoxin family protein [Kiritimatiellia bacterium]
MNIKRCVLFFRLCALSLVALVLTGCPSRVAEEGGGAARDEPAADVWTDDIEGAFKAASESGRPVFIDFTGSDWCGWCKLAEKNIFSTRAWADFASELVCLKVDFPQRGRPDVMTMRRREDLAKAFGVEGFPTLVLATAERKELARFMAGRKGSAEFIAEVRKSIPVVQEKSR